MRRIKIGLTLLLPFGMALGCTKSSFRSLTDRNTNADADAARGEPKAIVKESAGTALPSTIPEAILAENLSKEKIDPELKGGFEVKTLVPNFAGRIWMASDTGIVQLFKVENRQAKTPKTWTGANPKSGTRTYVLEGGGVILAKNGGHLYFLHEGVPEGAIDTTAAKGNYFRLPGVADDHRSCVVSYKHDGKRFLGIGYGLGSFVRIEQDNIAPYAPKFATLSAPVKVGGGAILWGYSCYVDQTRLIYYSQFVTADVGYNTNVKTMAIDLKTMTETVVTRAPNAGFQSTNLPNLTIGPLGRLNFGSYAMSGDPLGNVFNGKGFDTLAYEPKESMVWGSSGTSLSVYPHECLYKTAECKNFASYDLAAKLSTGVGPLSALGDGNMVGLVRHVGDIYLFRLKVSGDATKDIESVKIGKLAPPGSNPADPASNLNPYMYTDFTGATLYINEYMNTFNFTSLGRWKAELPLRQLSFTWTNKVGSSEDWQNIKAEIRCYKDPESRGEFVPIILQAKASAIQLLDVATCRDKLIDKAELRLTQIGNSSELMNVSKVQLTGYQ